MERLAARRWPPASVVGPLFGTWAPARSLASAEVDLARAVRAVGNGGLGTRQSHQRGAADACGEVVLEHRHQDSGASSAGPSALPLDHFGSRVTTVLTTGHRREAGAAPCYPSNARPAGVGTRCASDNGCRAGPMVASCCLTHRGATEEWLLLLAQRGVCSALTSRRTKGHSPARAGVRLVFGAERLFRAARTGVADAVPAVRGPPGLSSLNPLCAAGSRCECRA